VNAVEDTSDKFFVGAEERGCLYYLLAIMWLGFVCADIFIWSYRDLYSPVPRGWGHLLLGLFALVNILSAFVPPLVERLIEGRIHRYKAWRCMAAGLGLFWLTHFVFLAVITEVWWGHTSFG